MKHPKDNKTVDCFGSKHAVKQGERMIIVLKNIINKRGRTSMKEVQSWIGLSSTATGAFVRQLITEGYLETNSKRPVSLKATEKTKQLLGMASWN